ncbi:MAG: aspartyl-tRNA(Asn)/glutamyl-tRNA(Gln) amidotransferase subunit [Candidatus Parcubacteria bacterium]|jgi:aspartyl-tRNA(Asn)/glutamyl-tRNA(Gln) amidotransferase subunit B|nr:aspartyl-tRNA(Asn)/glutamyl-tRNA(Gln) amidotransferase subunit [Candidatus Parcubacteria bacterium]
MAYRPTIGLEIHAELKTRTKMFCDCRNDPDEVRPNVNICPICLAHPGTLPKANLQAIEHVLRVGCALGGTLADYGEFDRKSYFYPDIPKGYQISQYAYPFVSGGALAEVAITRVHLEEDTARSSHEGKDEAGEETGKGTSLVDFNRAGVPLMELVTEPVIHDAETAGRFARELQLLLRTLGASDANLEKGEMRVEANISISEGEELGTKVEVKNINSFRAVERTIAFEIQRQANVLESGGTLVQETRGWNENTQETFAQRVKEGSADYRYFPEPDLPKILRSEMPAWSDDVLTQTLPELPEARRTRYESLGMKSEDAAYVANDTLRSAFFDEVLTTVKGEAKVRIAANYFVSDLAGLATSDVESRITPASFAKLMALVGEGTLSSRGAKDTLLYMHEKGGDPEDVARAEGLIQVNDTEALREAVRTVIREHEAVAAEYRSGKDAALQFLVGQSMKATRGAGNPGAIKDLLIEELSK